MPVKYRGEADTQHSYQPNKKVWRRSEESVTLTVPERGSKRPKRWEHCRKACKNKQGPHKTEKARRVIPETRISLCLPWESKLLTHTVYFLGPWSSVKSGHSKNPLRISSLDIQRQLRNDIMVLRLDPVSSSICCSGFQQASMGESENRWLNWPQLSR